MHKWSLHKAYYTTVSLVCQRPSWFECTGVGRKQGNICRACYALPSSCTRLERSGSWCTISQRFSRVPHDGSAAASYGGGYLGTIVPYVLLSPRSCEKRS